MIVHRNDMIRISDVDPEELFNEVSCILDSFKEWENQLESALEIPDGRTLAISSTYH